MMMRSTCARGRKLPAGFGEGLHQAAREADAASDTDFVAGLIVKTADQSSHRAALGDLVIQDRAEQRDLEKQQQLHELVLEQLLHRIERLPIDDRQEVATDRTAAKQFVAHGLR